MPAPAPDAVLLVHGTFAHADEDGPQPPAAEGTPTPAAARWWQQGSDFTNKLNGLLGGAAACWPVGDAPGYGWSRPVWWWNRSKKRLYGRSLFAWTGGNSDQERRRAGRRL